MPSNTTLHASTRHPERVETDGNDDIVAVATPPGRGGIGIVRLSGPGVPGICKSWFGSLPAVRRATMREFSDADGDAIDQGLLLYFPAPDSYTGEHVLELHGHGSPVVMSMLVRRALQLGARMARPGEFSERAFLNGRLDLAQAEAVADLIESGTEAAARSAVQSLQGEFSRRIADLVEALTELRVFVEAAIDFPDEEIDFLADDQVGTRLQALHHRFLELLHQAQQGQVFRDGLKVVLTGLPNAGKSSLMNAFARQQRAIVSAIPGTTRDVLEQMVDVGGLPVEIIDTAGMRESSDEIEAEGVRRALVAQSQADLVLLVVDDAATGEAGLGPLRAAIADDRAVLVVYNKIDLTARPAGRMEGAVAVSVHSGAGMGELETAIREAAGLRDAESSPFMARQRHVDALQRASAHLQEGTRQLLENNAGELLAEELLGCQRVVGEITGEVTSDDLLGLIFGSFCIGK